MSVTPPDHFSASAWDKWRCPRQWAAHYIDGMRESPSAAMEVGTFSHAVLEQLMEASPKRRTVAVARDEARRMWAVWCKNDGGWESIARGEITERDFKTRAWRSITGLWDLEDPTEVDVVSTEEEIHWTEQDVPMVAIVDRVDRHGRDSLYPGLAVVDYKTGKVPKPKYEADKKRQITIGAMAVAHKEGPLAVAAAGSLLYVGADDPKAIGAPTDRNARAAVSEALQGVWAEVQQACADEEFPANPGPLCSWCPHVLSCEDGFSRVRVALSNGWVTEDAPGAKLVAAHEWPETSARV